MVFADTPPHLLMLSHICTYVKCLCQAPWVIIRIDTGCIFLNLYFISLSFRLWWFLWQWLWWCLNHWTWRSYSKSYISKKYCLLYGTRWASINFTSMSVTLTKCNLLPIMSSGCSSYLLLISWILEVMKQ